MMHLITGRQGTDHVTSANEGFKNSKIFGEGNIIFDAQGDFYARKIDDNTIRVSKGQGMMNGRAFENLEDTDLTIMTGTVALKRIDLICVRYEKNPNTELEKVELVVITGQKSVSEPTAPQYNAGNILNGDRIVDFPLYEVYINGLVIDSVTALFELHSGLVDELRVDVEKLKSDVEGLNNNVEELNNNVESLNNNVEIIESYLDGMIVRGRIIAPGTQTLTASGFKRITYDITNEGFTPVGIVGYYYQSENIYVYEMVISNNTSAIVNIKNTSSASISLDANRAYIDVLYVKNFGGTSSQILDEPIDTAKR